MALKIIETADGSSSIYNDELDEHYHSVHGSVREAAHVFIKMGLDEVTKESISIFEMGLGTGLNFMMTFAANEELKKRIKYTAVETYPLSAEIIEKLNYLTVMKRQDLLPVFQQLHAADWESYQVIDNRVQLQKLQVDIYDYVSIEKFDLIYFDAFGPRVQPHLWESEVFQKMYDQLLDDGILVTYCAKGAVRRTLQSIGFEVERLSGPPGKREMLRAKRKK